MKSPAHVIALFLAGEGVGTFASASGWGIYVSAEPATPENTVTVYDTGGRDTLLYDSNLRQPTIQARIRSANYGEAYSKAAEVIDALHNIVDQEIGGMHYVHVEMTGDVISIGRDDNDRHRLTANFQIIRQPIAQEA